MEWKVSLPIRVKVSKRRYFSLNLNVYRNAHFQTLNKAKHIFKDEINSIIKQIPNLKRCVFEYTLYPHTKRKCDISNICSIVDKFFSDAFVEAGKLPDDNYEYLPDIRYKIGKVDPVNPRVDVLIKEI